MPGEERIGVSIVVPAYNQAGELTESLSALQASAGSDAEIIVVDDASTDETPAVAARMGVRVWVHWRLRGAAGRPRAAVHGGGLG